MNLGFVLVGVMPDQSTAHIRSEVEKPGQLISDVLATAN